MKNISHKSIERLSMYRRLLQTAAISGLKQVYSQGLAEMSGGTAAQVRRDLMGIGCVGNPKTGYDVDTLISCIGNFLDNTDTEPVALVGVGNLGRALLDFFSSQNPKLKILVAFDNDPKKTDRVISGCRCYDIAEAKNIISREHIRIAVLAVPADVAQAVSEGLVEAGVEGFLNFAREPLLLRSGVVVENIDMMMALEKTAFLVSKSGQLPILNGES